MKNDNFEASEQTSGETSGENLSRQLGVWDAAALLVGVILGSGIFVAPSVIAQATPHFSVAALLWLLGGVAAGAGAITYAECGARLPKTGGFYIFYREAYGEPVAFVGGLLAQVITYPASLAAIALIFAQYLLQLLPVLEGAEVWVAAGALLAAGLINYVGVKAGAMSQKILTAFKVLALILVVVAALFAPDIKSNLQFYTPGQPVLIGFAAAVAAVMTLMWTYDGWADVTLIAGELKNPARDLGRAVLFGMGSLIVLYILVHFAVATLLPHAQVAGSEKVLADAVAVSLGSKTGTLVAALVVISTLGALNGIAMAASRLGFAMAKDGIFPRYFGVVHPRFQTPGRAIILLTAASLIFVFLAGFRHLLAFFSFSVWVFYGLTAIALFRLRMRKVGEPLPWRIPGSTFAPVAVLIFALGMTTSLMIEHPTNSLIGLGLMLGGFPIYFVWRRLARTGEN